MSTAVSESERLAGVLDKVANEIASVKSRPRDLIPYLTANKADIRAAAKMLRTRLRG